MGLIQPKPFLNNIRLRRKAIGTERRRNIVKTILEDSTFFPLPVTYEDIDKAFFDWVDKDLEINYAGRRLPTYRLFSNQRINEYLQSWNTLDENGNLIMNFKTITRENNPQHGESQGNYYNIPGHRDFPMFIVPVLQENGIEGYDRYTMKQPLSVNLNYTINFVCNKYELLNRFNELIHYEFSALERYIAPNGHYMPMTLESIADESEYTIDDRKYYSQTFTIKLMAYIIRKEDFKVEHLPGIMTAKFIENRDCKPSGKICKRDDSNDLEKTYTADTLTPEEMCAIEDPTDYTHTHTTVVISEEDLENPCRVEEEEDWYYNKILTITINYPECEEEVEFVMESKMVVTSIETNNVFDFRLFINGEVIHVEDVDEVKFEKGDKIKVKISRKDEFKDSQFVIVGYDPDIVFDKRINPESELDVIPDTENIVIS